MTVSQLTQSMSSLELTYWAAFAAVEPFGQQVDDYRAGIGAATYINMRRKRGAEPVHALKLFPWHLGESQEAPPPTMTPEQTAEALIATFAQVTRSGK
jgi:hypothetical protein